MGMLATWFVLAVVVGVIASNRGRSGFGWFVLSALISPLIGLILVLALRTPAADPILRRPAQAVSSVRGVGKARCIEVQALWRVTECVGIGHRIYLRTRHRVCI